MHSDYKDLIIIGAGGHGRVVADAAWRSNQFSRISFLDDNPRDKPAPFPIVGSMDDLDIITKKNNCFVVAIGDNKTRAKIQTELESLGAEIATVKHPSAVIGYGASFGPGTVVLANAVVSPDTSLGKGVIVNACAIVDHDAVVGNYCHIGLGAKVCSAATVCDFSLLEPASIVPSRTSLTSRGIASVGCVMRQ
ncbi:MAG: hypothetical protein Q4B51_07415 [Coriobacteriaceae bacterium]|nr:hypothetical protein [Coriobacteriaceae bacterium]